MSIRSRTRSVHTTTLHDELRDLARQLEHVHHKRWTLAQWDEFRRVLQEILEPMTPEELETYARAMQEWHKEAEAMSVHGGGLA